MARRVTDCTYYLTSGCHKVRLYVSYQHGQSICRAVTRVCGAQKALLLCHHLFACVASQAPFL
jgi:hypothetical protein